MDDVIQVLDEAYMKNEKVRFTADIIVGNYKIPTINAEKDFTQGSDKESIRKWMRESTAHVAELVETIIRLSVDEENLAEAGVTKISD